MLSSESVENAAGALAYDGYKEMGMATTNDSQQILLQQVGAAITGMVDDGDRYEWEFTMLESKEVNAFCLPGGKVVVYTGIMPKFKNEAELACVVAHEISHAIARHGGERVSWNLLQQLGALGVSFADNDALSTIYSIGTEYGVVLPYSRSHETEADLMGLQLMAKAGYDPKAAIDFWTRFDASTSSSLLEFASTHPSRETRVEDIANQMDFAEELYRHCKNRKGLGVEIVAGMPQFQ